jgi:hypothetical protein
LISKEGGIGRHAYAYIRRQDDVSIKAWEAERGLAKEERRKPRWTKPKQGLQANLEGDAVMNKKLIRAPRLSTYIAL